MNTSDLSNIQYDTVYCYPNSRVLKNKFDIHDADKLAEKERQICTEREMLEFLSPIQGNFDMEYIQALHKYIFDLIYDWAGEIRTIDIYKGGTKFCPHYEIKDKAEEIFSFIKDNDYFINESNDDKIKGFAKVIGDINTLHPFREGNGRIERLFTFNLAYNAGIFLDYSKTKKNRIIEASMQAEYKDYDGYEDIFYKIAMPI